MNKLDPLSRKSPPVPKCVRCDKARQTAKYYPYCKKCFQEEKTMKEVIWCCEGCNIKWEETDKKDKNNLRIKPICPKCLSKLETMTIHHAENIKNMIWYEEIQILNKEEVKQ